MKVDKLMSIVDKTQKAAYEESMDVAAIAMSAQDFDEAKDSIPKPFANREYPFGPYEGEVLGVPIRVSAAVAKGEIRVTLREWD